VKDTPPLERIPSGPDDKLAGIVNRERSRLRSFIRRRVPDSRDAEDILQDVFSALVEANRLLMPIDHVTGWLFRVARNRITDLFRARTPEFLELEDLLPSRDGGPEEEYARAVLLEALEQAIGELPAEQRDVFVGHELEGRSFKEMAAASGVGVNTLLSRKRYAVLRLRERLRRTYEDITKP
jgi:RNA polymerase sigma factor (sigma-70 family)